uniref:Uncharacterized protein n=1 Tax=Anguilla anguilla TaxID=7936 RepID=A0A0E9QS23_ANGAN
MNQLKVDKTRETTQLIMDFSKTGLFNQ